MHYPFFLNRWTANLTIHKLHEKIAFCYQQEENFEEATQILSACWAG